MKKVFLLLLFAMSVLISACGGGGGSDSPPPVTVPSAPAGVTITAGDTQIFLNWAVDDEVTSYNVYYGTTAGVTIANGTKVTGATSGGAITGLVNGTPYHFVVTAVNAVGESALSSEVGATPQLAIPGVPSGVTITAGNEQVSVNWTAVAGADSYNVYYRTTAGVTTGNGTKIADAVSGSAITGLVNGTSYYVIVTAVNVVGESAKSSEVSASPIPPPPVPTGLSLSSGNAQVILSWPNVSGATSYNVYYNTTTGVTIADGTKITNTTSGIPITGLTNGTSYYFVVTAVSAGGESAVSGEVGTTPQAPSAGVVSGLTISGGNGQVTLSWTAVVGATSYNVYYGTTAGVTIANGTKVTSATSGGAITGLTNGTQYFFVVTVMSNADTIENPASIEASATPKGIPNLLGGAIQTPLALAGAVTTITTTGAPLGDGQHGIFLEFGLTTDGTNLYTSTWYSYNKVEIATGVTTLLSSFTNMCNVPGVSGCTTGTINFAINAAGITTDGNNLFIAGSYQHTIDKFTLANPNTNDYGILSQLETTLAGSVSAPGSADGAGPAARFNEPFSITTDGSNLYVADSTNHTIRKVVIATGVVSTIAGTAGLSGATDATGAAARFNSPKGITTDGTYLYVSDTDNNLIRKVLIADGTVTTVAGGFLGLTYDGTGAGAKFTAPRGLTTDGTNLYVADSGAHIIRKVEIATGVVTTIAGSADVVGNTNGMGSDARFNDPRSITTDGTSLFVGDYNNGVIRKIQ